MCFKSPVITIGLLLFLHSFVFGGVLGHEDYGFDSIFEMDMRLQKIRNESIRMVSEAIESSLTAEHAVSDLETYSVEKRTAVLYELQKRSDEMTSVSKKLETAANKINRILSQLRGLPPKGSPNQVYKNCPSDWVHFGNHCYQISVYRRNWFISEAFCLSRGSHLASVHSEEEQEFLMNLLSNSGNGKFLEHTAWIGLWSPVKGPTFNWKWSDNTKIDYRKFSRDTDAYFEKKDDRCTMLDARRDDGWFRDICFNKRKAICKL